ncbi:DNA-processing protein DprA [Frondihabitans australicus]|uniref:DNA protecting protein DprA n=1 Tax=Frondihabitans australicus TaxID=386892 RepID=A0A495ICM6_9MICO|nr:DNA-processing protein DprA [Frondihabitans australicus]RKR73692.1 DNA protecting protein DprA [Frondihabitans australicus]
MTGRGLLAGFGDGEIADMLGGVGRAGGADNVARAAGAGGAGANDALASAVWSCLTEPGDGAAGLLRLALGPAGALAALELPDDEIVRRLEARGAGEASRVDLTGARKRWEPRMSATAVRSAFRAASVLGVRLVVPGDAEWPAGLDDLGLHGPAALWIRGDAGALTARPGIAIVGSRAATGYGEHVAADLSDGLSTRGWSVFSGGAYGIDGMAHRTTVASDGLTVAIMAGGVDRYYPAGNADLLRRVAETGAVVAEAPCGTTPSRWRFLQRNRLLAATTAATVVVEAGHRSGALNTANHARALERPLGAVPGPVTSPASASCHRLLREGGAECVTSPDDVVALVTGGVLDDVARYGPGRDAPGEMRVLDALSTRSAQTDLDVARRSGLAAGEIRGILAVLELGGRAEERETGWVRCH